MSMTPETWKFIKYAKDYGVYDKNGYLIDVKKNAPEPPEGEDSEEIKNYAEYVKLHNDALAEGIKL